MVKCKECGCSCKGCLASDHDVHLHVEIENLKQKLVERENHIVMMETNFLNEANKFPSGELVALREELLTWQDKYRRLYDAHRRVQRVNQGLEDKLLKLVDVCETEKGTLTKDVGTLSQKLAEANYAIKKLTDDNERYKNDVSLAIQFLQCKQSNFVAHKFDSLPQEVQVEVSSHMTNKRKPEEKKVSYEMKSIKVPIPTFPPTAMVYSVPKSPRPDRRADEEVEATPEVDIVSAAIMAKVLEERQKDKAYAKHCDTCICSKKLDIVYDITHHTTGTQTGDFKNSLCLRCNEDLPPSPQKMILVKQDTATKKVPIYPNESTDIAQTNGNNVVKVQPNNFLTDETRVITTQSNNNNNHNNNLSNNELKSHPDINFFSINEAPRVKISKSPKLGVKLEHHHLCSKTSPKYEVPHKDKSDSDVTSAKNGSSDNLKGPRYCSMRLQSGTKNILLDNAHNNVAPILYKRHHKFKRQETPTTHETSRTESCSSEDLKNTSLVSDNSVHNQQRVADWIQNNLENEISSSENSRSEPLIRRKHVPNLDKFKYAEMEENVKRFLFGESEFLKTVELGKLKYQTYRENDGDHADTGSSRSNSRTETEI